MRDRRTGPMHDLHLIVGQMDAMAEHGARPAQRVVIVDVEIALALREQLLHPGHLALVLRHVGLHVALGMLLAERTGRFELLAGAGGANRGVMAYISRPRSCHFLISALESS